MSPLVEIIDTTELGDRTYVAHDGREAVVVDPQRDVERVEAVLAERGLTCSLVVETHIHNDYVTGGLELARRTGAEYGIAEGEAVSFAHRPLREGREIAVGSLTVEVVATPGHTDRHLAYVVRRGGDPVLFSGGSLLFGGVGRTDLVDPARTDELSRAQYRSVRRLADLLPAPTPILPTHGFGSFCSSTPASATAGTIAGERLVNAALREPEEAAFVARLLEDLGDRPSYYTHMAALNRQGPGAPPTGAADADAAAVGSAIERGEWVVDLRPRARFAAGHLAGTVALGAGDQLSTQLGWLAPWGSPITLLSEDRAELAVARTQLARIGIDRVTAADPAVLAAGPFRTLPRVDFVEVAAARARGDRPTLVDVRRAAEREYVVPGAVAIPLHELEARIGELPAEPLWVHCAAGYRAATAASLLARAGRDAVLVDDTIATAVELGLARPRVPVAG